jgi:hypothetical protein
MDGENLKGGNFFSEFQNQAMGAVVMGSDNTKFRPGCSLFSYNCSLSNTAEEGLKKIGVESEEMKEQGEILRRTMEFDDEDDDDVRRVATTSLTRERLRTGCQQPQNRVTFGGGEFRTHEREVKLNR